MEKMMESKFVVSSIFLALIVAMLLISPHVSFSAEKKDVRIMWISDLTGPYSTVHTQMLAGAEDFTTWANKTNYIEGINLILDKYDHGMDVGKAVAAFHAGVAKTPRPLFTTGGMSTTTALSIKPLAEREEIPSIDGTSARALLIPAAWSISVQTCYEGQLGGIGKWIIDNWKPDSKIDFIKRRYQKRPPRLAVIAWDNAFGRSFDQTESRAYLKKIGVDFYGSEYIPMSPIDTTPQLLRLKEKGIDFAFMVMYANAHAVVLKDAVKLGMDKDIMLIGNQIVSLADLKKYVGDLANGNGMLSGYLTNPNDLPTGLKELYLKRKGIDLQSYCVALTYLDVMSEAIRKTIKRVGINKLDGKECWYSLMNEFKNIKIVGYLAPMTFGPNKLYGADSNYLFLLENGEIVVKDKDVYCPDLLPGGKDVPK